MYINDKQVTLSNREKSFNKETVNHFVNSHSAGTLKDDFSKSKQNIQQKIRLLIFATPVSFCRKNAKHW